MGQPVAQPLAQLWELSAGPLAQQSDWSQAVLSAAWPEKESPKRSTRPLRMHTGVIIIATSRMWIAPLNTTSTAPRIAPDTKAIPDMPGNDSKMLNLIFSGITRSPAEHPASAGTRPNTRLVMHGIE